MSVIEPVKFLYAADLRLDKPLALGEGGSAFADRARDVAYEATRRLMDCALSREVDFILLRGELFDADCGAGAVIFLAEQAARLSDAGIACGILNEGARLDPGWSGGFPPNVSWLDPAMEEKVMTCRTGGLLLTPFLEFMPPPLQGLAPQSAPGGAWLVSVLEGKEPEKEFIELDALRWEHCELDVTALETEEDLAAAWKSVKDGYRERGPVERPILLHLKLTGVMKERGIFYGENSIRAPGALMKKLNAGGSAGVNCILVNSLEDDTSPLAQPPSSSAAAGGIESDFWGELSSFKSGIDLRVGLFDALKERGVLKRVLASGAAPLLENMTEADVEPLLKESCDMAAHWLFKGPAGSKEVASK